MPKLTRLAPILLTKDIVAAATDAKSKPRIEAKARGSFLTGITLFTLDPTLAVPRRSHKKQAIFYCLTARKKRVWFVAGKGGSISWRFVMVTCCHGSHTPDACRIELVSTRFVVSSGA
jgi:hypothetical protein